MNLTKYQRAKSTMRIDIHTHFQCLDFIKHLKGPGNLPQSVLDCGTYSIQCAPGLKIPAFPNIIDIEKKLRSMEDMKIDIAVLSHGIPFGPDVLGGWEADDWAMRINDNLTKIIAAYPSKFVGLGSIGFGDRGRSIAEVDETPDLRPIVSHIGGVIPYLWGRIAAYSTPSPLVPAADSPKHSIDHYLSRLYVDTVCSHIEALECCHKVMGTKHLLYGTDHPFGRYDVVTELIEQLNCSKVDRELIYHGNAEQLLNLRQPTTTV